MSKAGKSKLLLTLSVLTMLLAATAQAGVIEYDNEAAWLAATRNTTTLNFGTLFNPPPGNWVGEGSPLPISTPQGQVTLSAAAGFYVQGPYYQANLTRPLPDLLASLGTNPGLTIRVDLPAGITAFGLNFFASSEASGTTPDGVELQFLTTSITKDPGVAVPLTLFRGFTSTDDIPYVNVMPVISSACVEIQTFSLGQTAPVPEPAVWVMIAGGILAVAAWRRRNR